MKLNPLLQKSMQSYTATSGTQVSHHDHALRIIQSIAILWNKEVNLALIPFVKYLLTSLQTNITQITDLALSYFTQLRQNTPNHSLKYNYESRIIIASLMLSQKFLEDARWTNATWSLVSGIKLKELNQMERDLLSHLKWTLFFSVETIQENVRLLQSAIAPQVVIPATPSILILTQI